jgi:7,8-dihydropterin-6-yl-methyl-4-(beta-D-ribofuranosyl)aminobenzene 5'-phosphate synthase
MPHCGCVQRNACCGEARLGQTLVPGAYLPQTPRFCAVLPTPCAISMEISILVDNATFIDRYFRAEPGFSLFLEDGETKLLFDTGYSDLFIKNARKMGIDALCADWVVLSHGHLDHTGGLDALVKCAIEASIEGRDRATSAILAHPDLFAPKRDDQGMDIGCFIARETLASFGEIRLSAEPVWITDRVVFLGEIERRHDFEGGQAVGKVLKDGRWVPDFVSDDSGLACLTDSGLVVITGCAHAGICNTIEQARKVTGEECVADVIGGFHLLNAATAQIRGTCHYFASLQPSAVHACHCTDFQAKRSLARVAPLQEVGVGLRLRFD